MNHLRLLSFVISFAAILLCAAGAVAKDPVIKINYADTYPPLSFGEQRHVQGVLPALMDGIIKQGMAYHIIHRGKAWKRAQQEVWSGQADALITSVNPERLQHSYRSDKPVFRLTFRPFTKVNSPAAEALKNNSAISELGQFRFCDVHGNLWGKNFYKKHNIEFHTTRSFETCLRMLSVGRTDIVIHSDHILSTIIHKNGWDDIIQAHPQVMPESPDFYFLLSKKSQLSRNFLAEFDLTLMRMRNDGSYARLMRNLNEEFSIPMAFLNSW